MKNIPKRYTVKNPEVVAVQWPGGLDDVPDGWTLGPVPSDFGCGRSCYNPNITMLLSNTHKTKGMSLWRGDWCVFPAGKDYAIRMSAAEFEEMYTEIPNQEFGEEAFRESTNGQFLLPCA